MKILLIFVLLSASNIKNLVSNQTGLGFGCLAAFEARVFHFMDILEWRDAVDYEGQYRVSNQNQIKSLERNIPFTNKVGKRLTRHTREKELPLTISEDGYYRVMLCKDGKPRFCSFHILVAIAFVPNPDNLPQVNHEDGNKLNCAPSNLKWCDGFYNMRHASRMGLLNIKKGAENNQSKSVRAVFGDFEKVYGSMGECYKDIGVSRSSILLSIRKGSPLVWGSFIGYQFFLHENTV